MLNYRNPSPIAKGEAIKIFLDGTKKEICEALVAIAFYNEDWKWCQAQCLHFLNDSNTNVRRVAAICLGHIARIHKQLDYELVIKALNKSLNDKEIAGTIQDALDDIETFIKNT